MKEKKINEFLTLKQEEGRTYIIFKMVLIGTTAAGKSTFLSRILSRKFFEDTRITIGADFFTKKLRLDNIEILMHIWDLSGSERFALQLPYYGIGARGAIIMFDLTCKKEYIKIEKWLKFFRDNAVKDACFIIVGNKLDLIDSTYNLKERKEIQLIAQELNSPYFEISVKTGYNVNDAFNTIMNLMLEQIPEENIQNKLPFDFTSQLKEDIVYILEKKLLVYFSLEEKKRLFQQNVPAILTYIENNPSMFPYIFKEKLLDYLSSTEKMQIIRKIFPNLLICPYIFKERLLDYLSSTEKMQIIRQNFPNLLICVERITLNFESKWNSGDKISEETLCYIYLTIINAIEGTILMDEFFDAILEAPYMFTERSNIIFKIISLIKKKQELKQSESDEITENDNLIETTNDNWEDIFTAFVNVWHGKCDLEFKRDKEIETSKDYKQKLKPLECFKCGNLLPPKSMYVLVKKQRVYCPNCGILNQRKFSDRVRRTYLNNWLLKIFGLDRYIQFRQRQGL